MVRWLRWHCPPDTGFEIRALAVWGRARYLSVTEAPHNTDFHTWMEKKHFCFFETAETGSYVNKWMVYWVTHTERYKMKWNESGFRPPLCTYRLNWARRTSWGWWDDWDDTVLQTQDSKFEPWRSEVEHATSRSRRLPTILTLRDIVPGVLASDWTHRYNLRFGCILVSKKQTILIHPHCWDHYYFYILCHYCLV